MKIKFGSNNILPVDKDVNIHLATIVIRATFAQYGINTILNYFYIMAFIKMLEYERIDISEGIDVDMSDK